MAHAVSLQTLVLKTYDTGEADRFCILFTRERGRIAARAAGARRPKSKLGGLLLPFRHLDLRADESRSGWIITSAALHTDTPSASDVRRFGSLQEITEILLRLVPDEGELPEVFDVVAAFFADAVASPTAWTFRILHLLGFLPGDEELTEHFHLGSAERAYVNACRRNQEIPSAEGLPLERLKTLLLEPHLSSPLKAAPIAAMLG